MFWVGQQTQLSLIERSDRNLAWIHLTFLLGISLVPFASLRYLERSELLKPGGDADIGAIRRRIGYVQAVRRSRSAWCTPI